MTKRSTIIVLFLALILSLPPKSLRAGSEDGNSGDDCMSDQLLLADAKDEASKASQSYTSCLREHKPDNDCSSEKSAVDNARHEVDSANEELSADCQ